MSHHVSLQTFSTTNWVNNPSSYDLPLSTCLIKDDEMTTTSYMASHCIEEIYNYNLKYLKNKVEKRDTVDELKGSNC